MLIYSYIHNSVQRLCIQQKQWIIHGCTSPQYIRITDLEVAIL